MKQLRFIGVDSWSRPVYRDENGKLWKDLNLGNGTLDLYKSSSNDFEGEPDYPLEDEYEIVGKMEDYPEDTPCNSCNNAGWETMSKVAACNCCENHEFYSPMGGGSK